MKTVPHETVQGSMPAFLSQEVLLSNIRWFCRLRWCVAGLLAIFGMAARNPNIQMFWGLREPGGWPFLTAVTLAAANITYAAHIRFSINQKTAKLNLFTQIVIDLIVLTFVVYFVGSTDTHVPFVYLFHIVLSSIFFAGKTSFLILLLSSVLFGVCLLFERLSGFSSGGVFAATEFPDYFRRSLHGLLIHYASVLSIWAGVWYLAGHLAQTVRRQDIQMARTNQRLEAALEERMRHMLWTTHALKSPFAAISANTQLLLSGICGVLNDEALNVVQRIDRRCNRLSKEIQEMLQLANLESSSQQPSETANLDVSELLQAAVQQMTPATERRSIAIQTSLEPVSVCGLKDHFVMLFENLISNAVNYSYDGGQVMVSARRLENGQSQISIIDHGIGIEADKLPRIFEEYYRTKEAVAHNKESSGLGLAIVHPIVRLYCVRACVQSTPRAGTRFDLYF